ncbi:initiation-specific alpha-1,6-mannosyl transferase [Haloferula helveola]|uniref:Initiation-specific alpha-1,6-mannosyl transferase n=2 Tax=Haloferula helveola TaxID=490095 RepID=A0ABM7RFM8_9BACT|nr:initiation-specific alpha-1,6-mannosyl transferase [Haloferula helveola]
MPDIELPAFEPTTGIPKRIYQTCADPERLPRKILRNIRRMRERNPGWSHRVFSDADIERWIDARYGDRVLGIYRMIRPAYGAARADLFRYLLMYAEGGVYLDIKSTAKEPLDQVLRPDESYVLSHWNQQRFPEWGITDTPGIPALGEFQQWHIVAAAGHPFLRAAILLVLGNILNYDESRDGIGQRAVLLVTGPWAYTQAIVPLLDTAPHRLVEIDKDFGFEYTIYWRYRHIRLFKRHYSHLTEPLVSSQRAHRHRGQDG